MLHTCFVRGLLAPVTEELTRIEEPLRIEHVLQAAHQKHGFGPMFAKERVLLADADAVFAGAGATDGKCVLNYRLVDLAGACPGALIAGGRTKKTWKLPSPTWPRMGAISPASST